MGSKILSNVSYIPRLSKQVNNFSVSPMNQDSREAPSYLYWCTMKGQKSVTLYLIYDDDENDHFLATVDVVWCKLTKLYLELH